MTNSHCNTCLGHRFHVYCEKVPGLAWTHMYELTIMCSSLFLKHVYKGKPSGALGDAPGRKAEKLCTSALCLDGLLPACEFISFQWERGEGLQNLRVSWNPHWALSVEAQHRDLVLRGDLPWPNVCSSPFLGKWVEGQTRVPAFIKWHPTAPALLSSHEGLKALALGPAVLLLSVKGVTPC